MTRNIEPRVIVHSFDLHVKFNNCVPVEAAARSYGKSCQCVKQATHLGVDSSMMMAILCEHNLLDGCGPVTHEAINVIKNIKTMCILE